MQKRVLTSDELNYVRENMGTMTQANVAKALKIDRDALVRNLEEQGLTWKRKQTVRRPESVVRNEDYVREHAKTQTDVKIAEYLGITTEGVAKIRQRLGIFKARNVRAFGKKFYPDFTENDVKPVNFELKGRTVTGKEIKRYDNTMICEYRKVRYVVRIKSKRAVTAEEHMPRYFGVSGRKMGR